MAVITGANGALTYQGSVISRCRSWSLDVSKSALEDTCLGVYDRTYIEGLRGATGSAVILYDPEDANAVALLNRIFSNSGSVDPVGFVLHTLTGKKLECLAIITNQSTPMSVGEAVAVSITLQITGPISGAY